MDQKDWEKFFDTVKANTRPHAGYFAWTSDRTEEEIGVVQSFHESLEHHGQGFFHSYQSRGDGNDPPDCEALSSGGDRIAIEVTELVDSDSIIATKSSQSPQWEPYTKKDLCELLGARITKKDNPREVKGEPYKEYVLLICCDEPRVLDYNLIEDVRGHAFPGTNLISRAFLLFSYCPREKCCPYIELQLGGA